MFAGPSLTSHTAVLSRTQAGVDEEGTPLSSYLDIATFRGGFGAVSTARSQYAGADGQQVEAAITTQSALDFKIDDKVTVAGHSWRIIGVRKNPVATRLLLATWGIR